MVLVAAAGQPAAGTPPDQAATGTRLAARTPRMRRVCARSISRFRGKWAACSALDLLDSFTLVRQMQKCTGVFSGRPTTSFSSLPLDGCPWQPRFLNRPGSTKIGRMFWFLRSWMSG